jgi:methylenetetrahydrofolate reductase (NADPH)
MDKPLIDPKVDLPGANGEEATKAVNGDSHTNGINGEPAGPRKEENPSLIDAAKAAAVEVTNGMRSLAMSN